MAGLFAGLLWVTCLSARPAFAHGDLHEQIETISARILADPGNAQLVFHRAELYRDHEEWALSAADYDRAEQLAPGNVVVRLGRGRLLIAMGKLDAAKVELDAFIAAEPGDAGALADRAQLAQSQARFEDAATDYASAIEHADSADAELYLGRARALAAAGKIDQALAGLDEGSEKLGHPPTLGLLAVELERSRNNFDAALSRIEKLRAGAARQEAWLERRGDLLAAAGRADEARQAWSESLHALDALPVRLAGTDSMQALRQRLNTKLAAATR
jgi:predicted Zn-dependent protease